MREFFGRKKHLEIEAEADKIEESIIENFLILRKISERVREQLNRELKEELFFVERGAKIGENRQSALNNLSAFIEKLNKLFPENQEIVEESR